jgi:hypothetical protein
MQRKAQRVTTRLGGVRKPGSAGNCAELSSAQAMTEHIRSNTKLKLWQTESLAKHKIKTLADPVSTDAIIRLGQPRKWVDWRKERFQIGTEFLLHCTSHTVSGLRAMPAPRQYVP